MPSPLVVQYITKREEILNKLIFYISSALLLNLMSLACDAGYLQRASFSIKVADADPMHTRSFVQARVYSDYHDWFNATDSLIKQVIDIDDTGQFHFQLPDLNKPLKFNLVISDNKGGKWSKIFYAEPGDVIQMTIHLSGNSDSITVDGRGYEKYALAIAHQTLYYQGYFPESSEAMSYRFQNHNEVTSSLAKLAVLLMKYNKRSLSLDTNGIDSKMLSIIRQEFAYYDREWAFRCESFMKKTHYRNEIAKVYWKYRPDFTKESDSFSWYAPSYIAGIVKRDLFEATLRNNYDNVNLVTFYNHLKNGYLGNLKDRTLGYALLQRNVISGVDMPSDKILDSILSDAIKIVDLDYVRRALVLKQNLVEKLADKSVINAYFTDLNNRNVYLKEFRGKVVLIEAWFNGCFGCAGFHKAFHEKIYPDLQGNAEFAVVSINVDKTDSIWKAALATRKYSSDEYYNVRAIDGVNHHFFKFYQVTGMPWIMLIDRLGNIVYQPTGTSVEALREQIMMALRKGIDQNHLE